MGIQRRYGPTRAAGTVVVERPAQESITQAARGVACMVGQFERGKINTSASPKLNRCPGPRAFEKKCGGRVSGMVAPDCAQDYFDLGRGAGELIAVRVTDGHELTSEVTLYSRDYGTDYHAPNAQKGNEAQVKRPVLKVVAKNGGAWGGRRRVLTGSVNTGAAVAATTLTTGITMKANEFAGATLTLAAVAFRSYRVVSNSTAGVLTVESDSTMLTDLAGSENGKYTCILDRALLTNGRKGLAVEVREGQTDPGNTFGLRVSIDGEFVKGYDNLSMDPTSAYYVEKVINEDDSNDEFEVVDLWDGAGQIVPRIRPANFYGRATGVSGQTVTLEAFQVVSAPSGVTVAAVTFPSGAAPVPHRLTFTWDSASNLYTVVASANRDAKVALANLADFSVGNGAQAAKTWTAPNKHTVDVTVDHISEPANASTLVIDVLPVNTDVLPGGLLAPNARTAPLTRSRIKSATFRSVTVESGTLEGVCSPSTVATVTGSGAGPFAVVGGTNDAITIRLDKRTAVAVTLTAGGARTAAQVAADINTAVSAVFTGVEPASVVGSSVKLTSPGGLNGGGPGSIVEIVAVANDAYTLLGFTAGSTYGTAGSEVQLHYGDELTGGFDGGAPSDQDFLDALAPSRTPLIQLDEEGLGVVQIATPGITSAPVQKAGYELAEARSYHYHMTFPIGTVDETAAVNYVNDTIGRSDFMSTLFPSWAEVPDPDRPGLSKTIPVVGMMLGRDALFARDFEGYHRPAAGIDCTLPRIVRIPTGSTKLNEEVLTPQGINVLKKKKGSFVVWGMRTVNKTADFQFRPHRLQMSHYIRTFLEAFDWVIFSLNDPKLRRQLAGQFRVFFQTELTRGAINGKDVTDAAVVKIDDDNNTAVTEEAGDLHADIAVRLTGVVERFVISIGKQGVFENTSN